MAATIFLVPPALTRSCHSSIKGYSQGPLPFDLVTAVTNRQYGLLRLGHKRQKEHLLPGLCLGNAHTWSSCCTKAPHGEAHLEKSHNPRPQSCPVSRVGPKSPQLSCSSCGCVKQGSISLQNPAQTADW